MTSWADESEDPVLEQAPDEYTGGGGVRPRLQLKPRSATAAQDQSAPSASSSSKSNPFGAAKPREEVLKSKGIDASLVDKRVERKANVPRLTAEQDKQVEDFRAELTELELKLREANEMELPEEDLRVASEKKRAELNNLVKGFHELNLKERTEKDAERAKEREEGGGRGGGRGGSVRPQRKFERPSERRRRLEQQGREGDGGYEGGGHHGGGGHRGSGRYNNYDDDGEDDPFSSFGSNRNRGGRGGRGRGGGGGSYRDRDDRRHSDHRGSRGGREGDGGYEGGGGRRSDYNDNYAADRYNY